MNNKGQVQYIGQSWADLILVPIAITLVAVIAILALFVHNTIKNDTDIYSTEGMAEGSVAKQSMEEILVYTDVTMNMVPYIFVMLIASMVVLMALSAYFIDSSIVFLVPGILILMFAILISVPLQNFYEEFVTGETFAAEAASYSLIVQLMSHMTLIVFLIGATFLLVMYGKKTVGGAY
jgi:hypothetical protein